MNRSRLVALGASAALVLTGGVAAAATGSGHRDTMTLKGDVLGHRSTYHDLGPTAGGAPVEVDVTLRRPDVAGELTAYRAMYTKGSGHYHDFLTVAQFNQRFGVAQATYDAVRDWATRDGLHVVGHPGSHDIVRLSGTASQAERTFGVTLHDFRVTKGSAGAKQGHDVGTVFHANVDPPSVPAGRDIQGVIGLNSLLGMHAYPSGPATPISKQAPHGSLPRRLRAAATPGQTTCIPVVRRILGCLGLTTPQDLWSVYDQPGGAKADPNGNLDVDFGQGQQMAVFGEGKTDAVVSNLRLFEKKHQLPRVPIEVVHTDGPKADYSDTAGTVEWELDTQASTGMAPDAEREVLYFGKDLSDASVLGAFSTWVNDPDGPLQANASFGECEENPLGDLLGKTRLSFSAGRMYTLKSEATLRQATMEGRTLFSSAGDTGSSCPVLPAATLNGLTNELVPIVNYPASSPYAVDVGGTVLYTKGNPAKRTLEYAWTFTGGGTSFIFPKPAYQDGIPHIGGRCLYTPGGGLKNIGKACRGAPDVAALSGDILTNGYDIASGGQTGTPGGGTSLSSPLWMGMWTRIQAAAPGNDQRGCGGGVSWPGLGFANESLYAAYKAHRTNDFFDIGGLSLHTLPIGNGIYLAGPGWDYVSGMGTPDVSHLIRDITGDTSLAPADPVLPQQPPSSSSTARSSPCTPLFTDATGDDSYPLGLFTGNNPQLDIIGGNIDYVTHDGKPALRTVLAVKDLTRRIPHPIGGASEYYFQWTYRGTHYFTGVQVGLLGRVTYSDGTVDGTRYTSRHADTGALHPGRNGTVVVDVPLGHVGSPPKGATLTAPSAQTKVLLGTTLTGGLIEAADAASAHDDYTVGDTCDSPAGIDLSRPGGSPSGSGSSESAYPVSDDGAGPLPPAAKRGTPIIVDACDSGSSGAAGGSADTTSSSAVSGRTRLPRGSALPRGV